MKKLIWLMVVLVAFAMPLAFADETATSTGGGLSKVSEAADSSDYLVKFPGMLVRGIVHVVASPFELLKSLFDETRDGQPVIGTLKGVGVGTMNMTSRALVGAWDIATCWLPQYNGEKPPVANVLTI